jgi:putative ABC transport system permease protein
VLLVACANLSNLQLARGLNRGRELAVRASIGATRRDLIALLLTESGILAVGGLLLGLLLSVWGIALLRSVVPPQTAGYIVAPQASWQMIIFAAGVSIVCMFLVGLLPAVRLSDVDLDALIKTGTGTGAHRANRTRYGLLVVAQLGFTMPVVTGAVLLAKGTWQYENPQYRSSRLFGFDADSVIVGQLQLRAPKGSYVRVAPIAAAIVSRARAVADVGDAGIDVAAEPANSTVTFTDPAGMAVEMPAPSWSYSLVSPGYFHSAGLPIEKGSGFADGTGVQSSVVVDRASGVYLWPRQNPVGHTIKFGDGRSDAAWLPVVGVLGDHLDEFGRARRAWMDTLKLIGVYKSIAVDDSVRASGKGVSLRLYVRPARAPLMVVAHLRRAFDGMDLVAPPTVYWGREQWGVSSRIAGQRFMTGVFSAAALICLGLAMLGVYGIVAQSVAQRRREIAVRISLGATPGGILTLILREGNVFVLAGVAIGLYAAADTVGWLAGFLAENDSANALVFGLVCAGLFAVAALAALGPAVRATAIDPVEALRSKGRERSASAAIRVLAISHRRRPAPARPPRS